jgi:hypothetical protein
MRMTSRNSVSALFSVGAASLLLLGVMPATPARADDMRTDVMAMFQDAPSTAPVTPSVQQPSPPQASQQASLGQQPFPAAANEADLTPSQSNTNQLNQLFQFETTPDMCAEGEAYVTGNFDFVKYPGNTKVYRYQIQGQYGVTDQIAVGGFLPLISSKTNGTHFGLGDIGIYAQYKLDRIINPQIINITGQLDLILPTGNHSELRDTGKFGVRPLLLLYKDFGMWGPGDLGFYGLFGFTLTTNTDVRCDLAMTYQINDLVGVAEFDSQAGDKQGRPLIQFTPGLVYRGLTPWEIGIGVPVGVNSGTPDWSLNFKLTYAFQK